MYRHMTGNEKNENWLDIPDDELGEERYRRAGRYLVNMLQRFAADGTFADTADGRPRICASWRGACGIAPLQGEDCRPRAAIQRQRGHRRALAAQAGTVKTRRRMTVT